MTLDKLKNYYKISFSKSNQILKRKSNLLRYYLHVLLYIITLPLLLSGSCVGLAFNTMAINVSKGYKSYNVFDSFKEINKSNTLYKTIVSRVISALIKIAILLVILLMTLPFIGIGWILMLSTNDVLYIQVSLIPTILVTIVYVLYLIFGCIPLTYIYAHDNTLSITNALKISFKASLNTSKHQLVLSILFEFIFKAIFISIIVVLVLMILYYKTIFNLKYDQLRNVVLAIIIVIIGTTYLLSMPRVSLLNVVMRSNIRADILANYNRQEVVEFSNEIFKLKTTNVMYENKSSDIDQDSELTEDNSDKNTLFDVSETDLEEVDSIDSTYEETEIKENDTDSTLKNENIDSDDLNDSISDDTNESKGE